MGVTEIQKIAEELQKLATAFQGSPTGELLWWVVAWNLLVKKLMSGALGIVMLVATIIVCFKMNNKYKKDLSQALSEIVEDNLWRVDAEFSSLGIGFIFVGIVMVIITLVFLSGAM